MKFGINFTSYSENDSKIARGFQLLWGLESDKR